MPLLMATSMSGCGGDDNNRHTGKHDIWFMGAVIDGATGTPLTTYEITLVWGTNTAKGKVDAAGRYTVGPLQAWNDYGITISNDAYRPFSSYNAGIAPPAPGNNSLAADIYSADTSQTFNFNASLFPKTVAPPDISIGVIESGVTPVPAAGHIRLQPTTQPAIQSQPAEVVGQTWTNDTDLYAGAISADFTGGVYKALGSALTYGVTYSITVYGVEGYQPGPPTTVQAGITTGASIVLVPLTLPPLQLIANTVATCRAPAMLTDTSSAVVTLTFNETVEDGTTTAGGAAEALDNGLSLNFLPGSTLATSVSSTVQERGTTFTIADNVVTLSFNPNVALTTKGPGDVIRTVTYSALGAISLQPPKHPELKSTLSQFLNPLGLNPIICTPP